VDFLLYEMISLTSKQEINDLVISPINPQVLVSASEDTEIRLWSLDPAHKEYPCVAICAGEGHREALLSIVSNEILCHRQVYLILDRLSMRLGNISFPGGKTTL
jgi:WD40 repeat protein